jgi:rfaE bifunctional protein kinase chain/domain
MNTLTKSQLESALEKARELKIGVLGDFCLDRYIVGKMQGISREAPVPIVQIESDEYLPGAAGNTTLNVHAFGAEVVPIGVVGQDLSGEILVAELEKRGISTRFLFRQAGRHTTSYSKIYAHAFQSRPQQVARFDRQNTTPLSASSEKLLLEAVEENLSRLNALIVDDYGEHGCPATISESLLVWLTEQGRQHPQVISIADSRERIVRFKNFAALVPNEIEAAAAVTSELVSKLDLADDATMVTVGRRLQEITQCHHVIITRGERGATVVPEASTTGKENTAHHLRLPPVQGEIDVTGAGDTFAAALAVGMAANLPVEAATTLANLAARIAVRKTFTTGTASPEEIRAEWEQVV